MSRSDAQALIESGDPRWYDFCADRGHLPGNVDHMPSIQDDFIHYIEEEC